MRLSEVIARPGIYTNSKRLNIPNQTIAIIDPVSDKYRKIEELNLRGNCIAQLGEICQFTGLRMLDLTNNKVADWSIADCRPERVAAHGQLSQFVSIACRGKPLPAVAAYHRGAGCARAAGL